MISLFNLINCYRILVFNIHALNIAHAYQCKCTNGELRYVYIIRNHVEINDNDVIMTIILGDSPTV